MREINKKMNKKLDSATKEIDKEIDKKIESKAIDFFNIPKEIANNPSLGLEKKIVFAVMMGEIEKNCESGGKLSYDEALKNRIDKIMFEKMEKFEKEIMSNSPFPH